jgi:hypothetical protein
MLIPSSSPALAPRRSYLDARMWLFSALRTSPTSPSSSLLPTSLQACGGRRGLGPRSGGADPGPLRRGDAKAACLLELQRPAVRLEHLRQHRRERHRAPGPLRCCGQLRPVLECRRRRGTCPSGTAARGWLAGLCKRGSASAARRPLFGNEQARSAGVPHARGPASTSPHPCLPACQPACASEQRSRAAAPAAPQAGRARPQPRLLSLVHLRGRGPQPAPPTPRQEAAGRGSTACCAPPAPTKHCCSSA